jgi:hypothetical protein
MICVCMDFCVLKKSFPKDNFPTPFMNQIVVECASCEVFYFMDSFLEYKQIQINPQYQHKMIVICPWGTFTYKKMNFFIKNVGATFQQAILFAFHHLKHIVKEYLDDLASCSYKRSYHPINLRLMFERCRYYRIHLNPNKCSFCVISRFLLGFIVSTKGIMADPLKVEEIVQFPPMHTVPQLQNIQGKAKFLWHFFANYANITKGFMTLFKKWVPFY